MFDPLSAQDHARISTLAATFQRIGDEQMKDLGFYNSAIRVEAVGFRRWEGWLAGILITPWFMNFIMLPAEAAQLSTQEVATKFVVEMPRADITFTVGEVEEVGKYLASSLYSPMNRFDVHEVAVTTAWASVEKYFRAAEAEEPQACSERL